MISKRTECSYLLDDLREISKNYYINKDGEVVNINGEVNNDQHIINKTKFYILYCMAYKSFVEISKNEEINTISREFINRALTSYKLFDYFINVCIAEYKIYDEIGTGILTYLPYKPIADFFFENEARKNVLLDYIKSEIMEQKEEISKKRVK